MRILKKYPLIWEIPLILLIIVVIALWFLGALKPTVFVSLDNQSSTGIYRVDMEYFIDEKHQGGREIVYVEEGLRGDNQPFPDGYPIPTSVDRLPWKVPETMEIALYINPRKSERSPDDEPSVSATIPIKREHDTVLILSRNSDQRFTLEYDHMEPVSILTKIGYFFDPTRSAQKSFVGTIGRGRTISIGNGSAFE